MPVSQVLRHALSAPGSTSTGVEQIEWDARNYRETVASAGFSTVRGIQGGKAYFTDEDGVTRVVSEPVLAELLTRSYFWRRGYLFDDAEHATLKLGPAGPDRVSLRLLVRGGNPLLLTFDRRDLHLVAARSAGLALDFSSATRWRDSSRRGTPVDVELREARLPTGTLEDATIGGWIGTWPSGDAEAALLPSRPEVVAVSGRVADRPLSIAFDSEADGPVRLRPAVADALPMSWSTDVFGRRLARGARVTIGTWSAPSVSIQASEAIPEGADASLGGTVFREAIVEYDHAGRRLRLHDPEKWVRPEGFYRAVLDDDGNKPVAILHERKDVLRLRVGAAVPAPMVVAPESAQRAGLPERGPVTGLRWGPAPFPPLALERRPGVFDFEAGDDGRLSASVLLRFQAFIDMPNRWAYLKPEGSSAASPAPTH